MLRRLAIAGVLAISPSAALAEGGMPQMDFQNPLTLDQIFWMVVILVALYFALSRWALPGITVVLENREAVIKRDLDAARAAKAAADQAVKELDETMRRARGKAAAEIADAVAGAKSKAAAEARDASARLDAQLAESEAEIATARAKAMDAIKPVARDTVIALHTRLIGQPPGPGAVERQVTAAMARRDAA